MFLRFVLLAAALLAAGGLSQGASPAPAAVESSGDVLLIEGVVTEEGVPARFTKVVDLRTGYSRTTRQTGGATEMSGYDGMPWDFSNGSFEVSDLPSRVADERARAFVDRAGWREAGAVTGASVAERSAGADAAVLYRPPDGSDVRIAYDASTRLPTQVTIDADYGPTVTSFADWRPVGPFHYPFRRTETRGTGAAVTYQAERVRLLPYRPALFARPASRQQARLVGGRAAAIAVERVGARRAQIVVPARVSGHDASFVFDTGASDNYLVNTFVASLHLPVSGGLSITGVGSSSSAGGYAMIDRLSLGSAELRNQNVVTGPSFFPSASAVSGLLGYPFLAAFRTTIDYRAGTLTFRSFDEPWDSRGTRLPIFADERIIYVAARIGGVEGLFRVDSGDGGTLTIFPAFAQRHGLDPGGEAVLAGNGAGGGFTARPGRLASFSIGGLTFHDLPVRFSQNRAGAFASRSLAGNMGGGILQCFRVTFDYRAHVLALEPQPDTPNCAQGAAITRD